jgi:hypothetical protein
MYVLPGLTLLMPLAFGEFVPGRERKTRCQVEYGTPDRPVRARHLGVRRFLLRILP